MYVWSSYGNQSPSPNSKIVLEFILMSIEKCHLTYFPCTKPISGGCKGAFGKTCVLHWNRVSKE